MFKYFKKTNNVNLRIKFLETLKIKDNTFIKNKNAF